MSVRVISPYDIILTATHCGVFIPVFQTSLVKTMENPHCLPNRGGQLTWGFIYNMLLTKILGFGQLAT